MKITLLDKNAESTFVPGTNLDLAVRATEADGSPAANANLQWATFGGDHVFTSAVTSTGPDGVARTTLRVKPRATAKPEVIFVRTPGGQIHRIGTFYSRTPRGVLFAPSMRDESSAPFRPDRTDGPRGKVTANGSYTLTIAFPPPTFTLPADTDVTFYVEVTDNNGVGVQNAPLTVNPSSGQIQYPNLPITTDATGWAQFPVRATGLKEQAPDRLDGSITVSCAQYNCSDTKDVHFDTSAGGPIYLTVAPPDQPFQVYKPQLVKATVLNRDGTPAKGSWVSWFNNYDGSNLNVAAISRGSTTADDSGTSLVYVQPNQPAGTQISLQLLARSSIYSYWTQAEGNWWYSDAWPVQPGDDYGRAVPWFTDPQSPYDPFKIGVPQKISAKAPNSLAWNIAPSGAPASLSSPQFAGGVASVQLTGQNAASSLYNVGITGSYTQEGKEYIVSNTYAFTNTASPTQPDVLKIKSADGQLLDTGEWHTIEAIFTTFNGTALANMPVRFSVDSSSNSVQLEYPYPGITGPDGIARIKIKSDVDNRDVVFNAAAFNSNTGKTSYSGVRVLFEQNGQPPSKEGFITIVTTDQEPLQPYQKHKLTATYLHNDDSPFKNATIVWSAFPSGQFTFDSLTSTTGNDGKATVNITASGDDAAGEAIVFARAYNADIGFLDIGSQSFSFGSGTPAPKTAHIALLPLDGDLVANQLTYKIQATYKRLDGSPISGQVVGWAASTGSSIEFQNDSPSTTDENGIAVQGIVCDPTEAFEFAYVTASATNPDTGITDSSALPFFIKQGGLVPSDLLGYMGLKITDRGPFEQGKYYGLQATYTEPDGSTNAGDDIYWGFYPDDGISFQKKNPTTTNSSGVSTNQVTAEIADTTLSNIAISASAPNVLTGSYDYQQTLMTFGKPQSITGIMIDKPFVYMPPLTTTKVDPTNKSQVIAGRITLGGSNLGGQSVSLKSDAPVGLSVFQNGSLVPPSSGDNTVYPLTSDPNGLVSFLVGAVNLQAFSLTASWGMLGTDTLNPTQLAVATIADNTSTTSLPPITLSGTFTPMPADVTAFTSSIVPNTNIQPTDTVAIIANDRIVFHGQAKDFISGVEIAYATLNSGANTLSYLRRQTPSGGGFSTTWERKSLVLAASGTPQTGPINQGSLTAPTFVGGDPIGPNDIVGGLTITIPGLAVGDKVTAYVYLSGRYPLTNANISDIRKVVYTVAAGDPSPLPLTVPQVYVAGYRQTAQGKVQANYKVENGSGTQWSQVASRGLNTTF